MNSTPSEPVNLPQPRALLTGTPLCGAKKRNGEPCRASGMLKPDGTYGRCRTHGQKGGRPVKHALKSSNVLARLKTRAEELANDSNLHNLDQDTATLRAALEQLLSSEEDFSIKQLLDIEEAIRKMVDTKANVMKTTKELMSPDEFLVYAKAIAEIGRKTIDTFYSLTRTAVFEIVEGVDERSRLEHEMYLAYNKSRADYGRRLRDWSRVNQSPDLLERVAIDEPLSLP